MPLTINPTPQQEQLIRALVDCGYYGNLTEVGHAAFDHMLKGLTPAQRREIAMHLYTKQEVTLSRVAEILDVPVVEARRLLSEAGTALATGTEAPAAGRARNARAGAAKYRR